MIQACPAFARRLIFTGLPAICRQTKSQTRSDKTELTFSWTYQGMSGVVFLSLPDGLPPIQVTWFGYVGATGLRAMDYLLVDRYHVCPAEDAHYVESVLRMPNGYACYEPLADAPPVVPLPALRTGHLTFGCFNNPAKFSSRILDAWAEILRRVPTAQLLLKYTGLGEPEFQADLRHRFIQRGIVPDRLLIQGWSPPAEALAAYSQVDLALDTQPYSGRLDDVRSGLDGCASRHLSGQDFCWAALHEPHDKCGLSAVHRRNRRKLHRTGRQLG